MVRYFMQLRGAVDEVLDSEGSDFPSPAALRNAVLLTARDLIAADVRRGLMDFRLRIDAEDESGAIVHSLRFEDAVSLIIDDASLRQAGGRARP